MQQLTFAVRLLAKPAIVRQAEPLTRRRVTDDRAIGQLSVIWCEPSSGIVSDSPEPEHIHEDQQTVAVSQAKPLVGADAMALRTTVGSIVDLRATRRTFHKDAG